MSCVRVLTFLTLPVGWGQEIQTRLLLLFCVSQLYYASHFYPSEVSVVLKNQSRKENAVLHGQKGMWDRISYFIKAVPFIQSALLLLCKTLTSKKDSGFCFIFCKGGLWAFLGELFNSLLYIILLKTRKLSRTFSGVCAKLGCLSS